MTREPASLTVTAGLWVLVAVSGTWRVVDGSGTDGLAGVAGGGTFEGTTGPDGSGTVTAIGSIACGA